MTCHLTGDRYRKLSELDSAAAADDVAVVGMIIIMKMIIKIIMITMIRII